MFLPVNEILERITAKVMESEKKSGSVGLIDVMNAAASEAVLSREHEAIKRGAVASK